MTYTEGAFLEGPVCKLISALVFTPVLEPTIISETRALGTTPLELQSGWLLLSLLVK